MSCWHPANCGYSAWKNFVHVVIWPGEARLAGIMGKPTLHVGGVHDAVTVADPGDAGLMAQDCVQVVPTGKTPGEEEVQVSGTLFRTTPASVLGSELFPITSVRVAVMVSAVPLEVIRLV